MHTLLIVGIVVAALATLAVLIRGIIQMFRGNDPRRSNKLMQMRVVLQFVALILVVLFMTLFRQ
jgi:NADH:ubiquinone oxidoreductase subunit 5 (subunit L)/multisubunit Na+/H+ antiporter MnhA subunit